MAKSTIVWLAGDDLSRHMLELAYSVLSQLKPDVEYVTGDLGHVSWEREGVIVPDRTLELVKGCECGMVITAMPVYSMLLHRLRLTIPGGCWHASYIFTPNCYPYRQSRGIQ